MSTSSLKFLHVLLKADVVLYYIFGLKRYFRELVAQHVLLMPSADLVNLAAVKKSAVAIGNSQRVLSTLEEPSKTNGGPKEKKNSRNSGKVMIAAPTWICEDDAHSNWRQESKTDFSGESNSYRDPEVVSDLGAILYAGQAIVGPRNNPTAPTSTKWILFKVLQDLFAEE